MATLVQIMDEIGAILENALVAEANSQDIDLNVASRAVMVPNVPQIDIYLSDPSEDPSYLGFGEISSAELITVRARVTPADAEAGQDLLLAFMDDEDPLSIVAALYEDPTLSGHGQIEQITRSGMRDFPDREGDGFWWGCLWGLKVVKAHS